MSVGKILPLSFWLKKIKVLQNYVTEESQKVELMSVDISIDPSVDIQPNLRDDQIAIAEKLLHHPIISASVSPTLGSPGLPAFPQGRKTCAVSS